MGKGWVCFMLCYAHILTFLLCQILVSCWKSSWRCWVCQFQMTLQMCLALNKAFVFARWNGHVFGSGLIVMWDDTFQCHCSCKAASAFLSPLGHLFSCDSTINTTFNLNEFPSRLLCYFHMQPSGKWRSLRISSSKVMLISLQPQH